MDKDIHIVFSDLGKKRWLEHIQNIYESDLSSCEVGKHVVFSFDEKIRPGSLEPLHLVTFACIIHFLISKGHIVKLSRSNVDVFEYIYNDLGFHEYWRGNKNHISAKKSTNIFNLWRILETEKDLYARHIEQYLKTRYFQGKDTSIISLTLTEAFYNVFDHAKAEGNAFLILKYNEDTHILSVAIADFGIGIPTSVRKFDSSFTCDKDALEASVMDNFTSRSTTHNKGMGLGIILSNADSIRIFSNHALAVKRSDSSPMQFYEPGLFFPGTLIYYEVDISAFEDEEIIDSFNW